MLTFDVHQHLWPPAFVRELRARTVVPLLRGDELVTPEGVFCVDLRAHQPAARIAQLDRDGIDVAVLSLQPTLGVELLPPAERDALEEAWLDGARELVEAAGGRFRALAPWRIAEGCVGTSVGASALLEPGRGADVVAAVDRAGGLVLVHPEAEGRLPEGRPEWWSWTAGYTAQMQRAYLAWLGGGRDAHPEVTVVFAQLAGGAPIHLERLTHRGVHVRRALDARTLFETSTYGRRAIELCIETFGVERLLYGSDVPVVDPRPTLAAVRGFGEAVAQLLQSETPGRLLA